MIRLILRKERLETWGHRLLKLLCSDSIKLTYIKRLRYASTILKLHTIAILLRDCY